MGKVKIVKLVKDSKILKDSKTDSGSVNLKFWFSPTCAVFYCQPHLRFQKKPSGICKLPGFSANLPCNMVVPCPTLAPCLALCQPL